jgi:hypothetical protein
VRAAANLHAGQHQPGDGDLRGVGKEDKGKVRDASGCRLQRWASNFERKPIFLTEFIEIYFTLQVPRLMTGCQGCQKSTRKLSMRKPKPYTAISFHWHVKKEHN